MSGLYVHIPFCVQKCTYCDFCSFPASEQVQERYVEALIKEMKLWSEKTLGNKVETLFIGGGTPTILAPKVMERIMNELRNHWNISKDAEITVEANPGTLTEKHLDVFASEGVTRISLGVQSSHDRLLKRLGRVHTWQQFINTYEMIRKHGDWDINLDLMYHLPGQSFGQWQETLEQVIKLNPEHISCYSLQLEEGTPLEEAVRSGRYKISGEDMDRKMHHWSIEWLQRSGYKHYEISNFARMDKQCKHNVGYWKRTEYIGLGLGAHSFDGLNRMANPKSMDEYFDSLEKNILPVKVVETLSSEGALFETVMLGLRMMEGIDEKWITDPKLNPKNDKWSETFKIMRSQGLVLWENERIRLTPRGIDISNQVFSTLMEL